MTLAPIAIADIHGRLDLLETAIDRFPGRRFVFLGDYIDRGPQSRAVIQRVRELVDAGRAVACLGNHDAFLLDFTSENRDYDLWMMNGGDKTLENYSGDADALLADAEWMRANLQPWHVEGGVMFAHAMRPDPSGTDADAHIWGRPEDTPVYPLPDGVTVSVHGHTVRPTGPHHTRLRDGTHLWLIDLGAVFYGRLCCLDCETWQATVITPKLNVASFPLALS